ncbi:zinc knuckle CX2CX4HX4C containing protein [Tanacetum coccineum]
MLKSLNSKPGDLATKFISIDGKPIMARRLVNDECVEDDFVHESNSRVKEGTTSSPIKNSFASVLQDNTFKKTVKLSKLHNEEVAEGVAVAIPIAAVEEVSARFENTLYGYFIGKRLAFPLVETYVKKTWAKYGLERVMLHSGFFFFQFATSDGIERVIESGPWLIRLVPLILNIWNPNLKLMRDAITTAPLWVKLHNVPIVAYSEIGLSLIRNTYARALIEVSSKKELIDSLVVAIPFPNGTRHTLETIEVEYEWEPPRCASCKIFDHNDEHFPKKAKEIVTEQTKDQNKDNGFTRVSRKRGKGNYTSKNKILLGMGGVDMLADSYRCFKVVKSLRFKTPLHKLLYEKRNVHLNVKMLRTELDIVQIDLDLEPFNLDLREEEACYGIVSNDVTRAVQEFFTNGTLLKELNHTIIALIPKIASPSCINDYRPKSCCNVMYKCISKILSNRLKDSLKDLVSLNQSVFVPGRRISDNILITQEIMHNYHLDHGPPRDCKELIEKVQNRIRDWKNKSLSAAGRLQLLCSVIGSMHIYWASVLILPTRILLDLKQLMRGFIWCQGNIRKGKAKVIWDVVCLPKKEGGLGIRKLDVFNEALMISHIWSLLNQKESLWVRWIHAYKLNGKAFGIPLSDIVSSRDIHRAGLNMGTMIKESICNGQWRWSSEWFMKYHSLAVINVPSVMPNCPLCGSQPDSHDHLFFECAFSLHVWNYMKVFAGLLTVSSSLNAIVDAIIARPKRRSVRGEVASSRVDREVCLFRWRSVFVYDLNFNPREEKRVRRAYVGMVRDKMYTRYNGVRECKLSHVGITWGRLE